MGTFDGVVMCEMLVSEGNQCLIWDWIFYRLIAGLLTLLSTRLCYISEQGVGASRRLRATWRRQGGGQPMPRPTRFSCISWLVPLIAASLQGWMV